MGHIFISYSHDDSVFAERLARDLHDAGYDVWIDFRGIEIGSEWEQAIFKGIEGCDFAIACLTPNAVRSDWVRREVLMARSRHKPIIPVLVKREADSRDGLLDTIKLLSDYDETRKLRDLQMVDFERFGFERAFPMLLEVLPGLIRPAVEDKQQAREIDPATIPNPFKGLEAFQQTDAHLFFGREDLTQQLLNRLDERSDGRRKADRFVAVVGASGSGKSSLVRAGLIPRLRAGGLPGSADWIIAIFTPGPRPTEAMAARLLPIIGGRMLPEVLDALERSDEALHQLVEGLLASSPPEARLLLVVDQFEEVFTRASETEAKRFLTLLISAVTIEAGRTFAVLTMRADFFDRLSAYPPLARLFENENLLIVTEMTPDALRRSIEGPADAVGLVYDHGLPDLILDDVRQGAGALPLMQYALQQLYLKRDGRRLSKTAYSDMGGVRGALAEHAETLYNAMPPETQALLRRLLLRLVEVSETGEATRRRVPREALTFGGVAAADVDALIQALTSPENRLLIANREVSSEGEASVLIELAHEALLRQWGRLAGWIGENQADLHYGGELLKDAQDWENEGRSEDYLLTGKRATRAQLWLERADANDLQRDYVQASVEEAEHQALIERNRQARELANAELAVVVEKTRATRFRIIALITSFGIVIALVLLSFSVVRVSEANQQLATAQFASTVSAFEALRLSTRIPGLGLVPPTPAATVAPQDAFATATQIAYAYGHEDDVIETFNGVEMVQVPAGCFFMGSSAFGDALPVTEVCFNAPFWIDRFEVTNAQYQEVMGSEPPSEFQGENRPVESITWFDARDFCEQRGVRLPTEAEWEYAAAGPDSYPYPWGRAIPEDIENYAVIYQSETGDVGADLRLEGRSWVGAYDMSGNVGEWNSSLHQDYPYDETDGREDEQNTTDARVMRGGAWFYKIIDFFRVSFRYGNYPNLGDSLMGFRCARDA